mmetsp:Transcript_2581/g.9449  ORF Transcript_2581/g.9449 Transcript_2581/m.9449 type:complete len:134 (-) Transcript_2581:171-572(-)
MWAVAVWHARESLSRRVWEAWKSELARHVQAETAEATARIDSIGASSPAVLAMEMWALRTGLECGQSTFVDVRLQCAIRGWFRVVEPVLRMRRRYSKRLLVGVFHWWRNYAKTHREISHLFLTAAKNKENISE